MNKNGTNSTEYVFAASGVDAVGEVVMCVDILPQPNGEHKISIKGTEKRRGDRNAVTVFFSRCLSLIQPPSIPQWWLLTT